MREIQMNKPVRLKLADKPAPLTAERAALAAAITKRADLVRKVAAIAAAEDAARKEEMDLDDQRGKWADHLPNAERLAVEGRVAAAMGEKEPDVGSSLADTKAALAEIDAQLATLATTRRALRTRLQLTEQSLRVAVSDIETLVAQVIWSEPEVLRLLADRETAIATQKATWDSVLALGPIPHHLDRVPSINHHSTADAALPWAVWRKALHDDAEASPPS
jgi:chromosome segregation ATPase